MKNDDNNVSERAAALINEAIATLERIENAPDSPLTGFLSAGRRREYRRSAARLRRGQVEPRYKNLHTPEELADIFERAARRDEILEQGDADLLRIGRDIRRVVEQEGLAAEKTFKVMFLEAKDAAACNGPDSEAAQRYRFMHVLFSEGMKREFGKRRQKPYDPASKAAKDPRTELRFELAAAEILNAPPPLGEAVIRFPAEDSEYGCGRVLMRLGIGDASWIGSFERGHKGPGPSTVQLMPDGSHLFVCAVGAGYIIDAGQRTLVEKTGTDIAGALWDDPLTVFLVDHDGMSLEAFGRCGRLWKTDRFGCGEFRRLGITGTSIIGETRQPFPPWWACFSVKLDTGEVLSTMRFEEEGDLCCQGVDLLQRGRTGSSPPAA